MIMLAMLVLILFHEIFQIERLVIGMKNNYMKMTPQKYLDEAGKYGEKEFYKRTIGIKIILDLKFWDKNKYILEKTIADLGNFDEIKSGTNWGVLTEEYDVLGHCHI